MSSVSSKRLGDILNLKRGYDLPENRRIPGPYPVISSSGISGYHNEYKIGGEGVIIGRYGTLGEAYYIDGEYWPHNTALYVTDFKRNDPKYIYYLLKVLGRIRTSDKSAVPGVNRNELHEMKVPVVESGTAQTKIAAALSALDAKIDLNNRISAELEAMARTLYDYWFVQFDFPDENGKPYKSSGGRMVYNPILKREIPEGWEVRRLGEIANITMGQSPPGDSLNLDGNGIVFFQGSTDFGAFFPGIRTYTKMPSRMAKQGDILLSVRAPVGDMNIASRDCCIGRGLSALHSKDGYDGFLFYVMRYFRDIFGRRNTEGTTFGSITKDDLHSLNLVYPPVVVLAAYEQLVSRTRTMIFNRSSENESLSRLRDWLLPMLMNGQVMVE